MAERRHLSYSDVITKHHCRKSRMLH